MKTQMQIVQEAIARIEGMSRGEFVETLVSSGLVEPEVERHELFSRVVNVDDVVEVITASKATEITVRRAPAGKVLSFAF